MTRHQYSEGYKEVFLNVMAGGTNRYRYVLKRTHFLVSKVADKISIILCVALDIPSVGLKLVLMNQDSECTQPRGPRTHL